MSSNHFLAVLNSGDICDSLAESLGNPPWDTDWGVGALLDWDTVANWGRGSNWSRSNSCISTKELSISISLWLSISITFSNGMCMSSKTNNSMGRDTMGNSYSRAGKNTGGNNFAVSSNNS